MVEYKNIIERLNIFLKNHGFSKKGTSFYRINNNNWEIIDLQKSKDSDANNIKFTINIGVSSLLIRQFNREDCTKKPDIWDAHWRERIGYFLTKNEDYWWVLTVNTNTEVLIEDVESSLSQFVFPVLDNISSDFSLIETWMNKKSPGITEAIRYIYLTILLKSYQKNTDLDIILLEFVNYAKNKKISYLVDDHLEKLTSFSRFGL